MPGRFKMEYRLFTIVRYNYRDYNINIDYIYYRPIKRCGTSFGSAEPLEPYPLPCLNHITLITYQFSLLLFVCLACPWPALLLRTLAQHYLAARLLAYQHPFPVFIHNLNHVSVFPCYSSSVLLALGLHPALLLRLTYPSRHPIAARVLAYQHTWLSLFSYFTLSLLSHQSKVFFTKVFCTPPPPWVLSPTFHFPLPFSPSWLPSASLLLCLLALCVASVVCGCTGELDWRSV
jgi:hypothetical protein